MATAIGPVTTSARVAFKSILFPTDFSTPSERALPFAVTLARAYGATIHMLHVLPPQPMSYATPDALARTMETQLEYAQSEVRGLETGLAAISHDVNITRAADVWEAIQESLRNTAADLIILGTHGRTGAEKFLLGSVAEEVFRRSPIPVLTVGPSVNSPVQEPQRFHRILFATDFSPHSLAALPHAIALAQQNRAFLILLHVMREPEWRGGEAAFGDPFEADTNALAKIVPEEAQLWCRPLTVLAYGKPADRILQIAREDQVDLIVLGLRNSVSNIGAATHLGHAVSHLVVARAACPVLTVRA
ncbi:MAG TPA: universal stress protein [Candidatus Acidoferrales bacterium]|nr:universal stress protein [Candidatus Acidoferrales bacterium]